MERAWSMILVAAFLLCSCPRKGDKDSNPRVETDDFEGVVFLETAEAYGLGGEVAPKRWTPTLEQAEEADRIAAACVKKEAPQIFKNLKTYKRQYVGYYRDGRQVVFINYFRAGGDRFDNWESVLVKVKDGGENYFEISVDLQSGSCLGLYVHGEA